MVAVVFALRHGEAWVPAAIQEPGRAKRRAEEFLAAHGHAGAVRCEPSEAGLRLERRPGWKPVAPLPSIPDPDH